jgi:hypothetical protein
MNLQRKEIDVKTASMGLKLYELPDAIREVEAAIIEAEGEITDEIADRLDHLEGEFERKAEYIALLSREAKAEAAAVKQEEDRLKARRTAAENRERRLKDYLLMCMTRLGVEKVEGERAKVRVQANGRPSITWVGKEDAIPEAFKRVSVSVDGALAYDTWKAAPEDERDSVLPEGFRVEVGQHVRVY